MGSTREKRRRTGGGQAEEKQSCGGEARGSTGEAEEKQRRGQNRGLVLVRESSSRDVKFYLTKTSLISLWNTSLDPQEV